jgi:serine/threonine protein kinase/Leucine-rich repeat (LRR) protein
MPPETDKIKAIFLAALEQGSLAERTDYLAEACGQDAPLRQSVEALLQAHNQTDHLLDRPAAEHLAEEGDGGGLDDPRDFLAPSQKPGSLGRLGHYEVLETAGQGGMGVVFRAFDEKLQRIVAIKALAPQLAASSAGRRRFVREARAAAAVTHEHVIPIYAVEEAGPIPYLVMQFVKGQSLQEKLERAGPLSLKETLRIGLHIAEGLAAAHRQGLVHRDIKPANILLENSVERVKITDFGLARASDDASLTQSGVMAGTPAYMSPEQAQGGPVDHRSDLFSLGSVLYAMCTGQPPFNAASTYSILKRVCEETPRPVRETNPEAPPWLDALLARLHAKAPADRFTSAQEVADLLAERLAELQRGAAATRETEILPCAGKTEPNEQPKATLPPPRGGNGFTLRRSWVMVAAVLLPLGVLGVGEATGFVNVRGMVIRLFQPEGTLVIEVDDPGVSISLDGEELVITGAGAREIRLKPGSYQLQATKDGKLIRQELVTIARNGREVVRVSREPNPTTTAADDFAWVQTVAALPAVAQVHAVAARLKELNPGFDGEVTPTIAGDVVTGLKFSADQVTDLSPVRALSNLTALTCCGSASRQGKLEDLSPLKGLRLTALIFTDTQVFDLSPLEGMPLTTLHCGMTAVSDLSPLAGMPLIEFDCSFSKVSDLSPLRGMRLERLGVEQLPIKDLSPLEGMPISLLSISGTQAANLAPLKGMPLDNFNLGSTQVSDLTPLKDMTTLRRLNFDSTPVSDLSALKGLPLQVVAVSGTKATDLSPLEGMPLEAITFDYSAERGDAELLRSLKTLQQINGKPVAEFWKEQGE